MNDSTAPGYLAQLDTPPAEDLDLDAVIQPAVVGITGLPDALVIIKGQPVPPLQPGRTQTWCAVGVTGIDAPVNADEVHDGDAAGGLGESRMFRQEEIEVTASFYGPAARATAADLRDGLAVAQNRDTLTAQGLLYVLCERLTGIADFENQQFVRRVDAVLRFRRMVGRSFAMRSVISLAGTVTADGGDAAGAAPVTVDVGSALAATTILPGD